MSPGLAAAPDFAARLAANPPSRIVVVQTAFLGDTVFSSALLAGLRARFPEAKLAMVVTPRGRDAARAIPAVDEVIVYDKRGADRGLSGFRRLARALHHQDFELAILPHRSLRTALLAHRARIPERVGFASSPARFFYTETIADPGGPFLAREAALLEALGAKPAAMKLVPREEDRAAAAALLAMHVSTDNQVGVSTGTQMHVATSNQIPVATGKAPARLVAFALGSEWETKIWPAGHTLELAQRLAARGLVPLLLGGPREKPLAADIQRACPQALDTTGNPIGEALALLTHASLCIGGDTGLCHAARALSIPTLLLFGPTDPALHILGAGQRALSLHLDCSPCGAHGAHRCPLGHHKCLRELTPAAVETAALEMLAADRAAPAPGVSVG